MSEINLRQKALRYAFLLLKYRLRSEDEIRQRLLRKKFELPLVEGVIVFLREKKFLDDTIFTRSWIQSRIARSLGLRRIALELKRKGVDQDIIQAQVALVTEKYREDKTVEEIAARRMKQLVRIEPRKAKARLYQYLARRGFSPDVIIDAVHKFMP
ncbi:MAG TPA: regulatory protein RecX [Candidatus Omnitrophota bacterium]|nr:regulatory protein RecX [Candidatus Omnitrophota bacterium]